MDNFEYDYKLLKDTRLAKNISIENIAFDLCLTARQIHSIENNLRDYFYSPAIKLVCVKKYAEKLGINTEVVLYKLKKEEDLEIDKIKEESANKIDEMIIIDEVVIAHHKTSKAHQTQNSSNQSSHIIIELSVEYIEKNLSSKITMSDLTKLTGYSERSLQLVYQKYLNQAPFEYIAEQRFIKARELIEIYKQSKKITEVAQEVGLVHLGRFSVNFRKRFGITPSALAGS
jgi:AraC-like DNA-binding protein